MKVASQFDSALLPRDQIYLIFIWPTCLDEVGSCKEHCWCVSGSPGSDFQGSRLFCH